MSFLLLKKKTVVGFIWMVNSNNFKIKLYFYDGLTIYIANE